MKRTASILLAALMVMLLLSGCGETDPIKGIFYAVSCSDGEDDYECLGEYIELWPGGTGLLCYNGKEYDLSYTYSAQSGSFRFRDENRIWFAGSFDGDTVTGTYGETYEYRYITIGAQDGDDLADTYRAVSCEMDGEQMACWDDSLVLEADGTGVAEVDGEQRDMLWRAEGDRFAIYGDGFAMTNGTIENGEIRGEVFGAEYVFSCNAPAVEYGQYGATLCTDVDDYDWEYYLDGEYMVLDPDGTGVFGFLDKEYDIEYACEEGVFAFRHDDEHMFLGTYENGEVDGTLLWGEELYRYVFVYGAEPVQEEYEEDLAAYTSDLPAGSYGATLCTDVDDYDWEYYLDGEYMVLNSDGTGVFFFGVEYDIYWACMDGVFAFEDEDGDEFIGTYTSDGVIDGVYMDSFRYVLEYGAEPVVEKRD